MFLSKKSLEKSLRLLPIDFSKPWWQLIEKQKLLVICILLLTIFAQVFWSLSPFLIAKLFEIATPTACIALFAVWICVDCAHVYARQLNARFQLQCIHSIYQNAHHYLLKVDVRYHVHRSSGVILGKIDRAARGYEDLLDQLTFEFVPLFVGLITMTITLSTFSLKLAVAIVIVFIGMLILGYYFAQYAGKAWENSFIATDDAFRAASVENLVQVQFIRALFASDYMTAKVDRTIENNMKREGDLWLSYTTVSFVLNSIYLLALFSLLSVLVWQVNHDITSIISAVGLTVAYIQSTKQLVQIAKPFRRYMRGWIAVKDLFNFIPTFGKQSYPVAEGVIFIPPKTDPLVLEARDISFDYQTAHLFNQHTLVLRCHQEQSNKLYGIIGPSGSGKTTLLSIVGGQLKPISGTVMVNGIDIYGINDMVRRYLIALQGQVATNVQGTIRYNLLFGLPEGHGYDDQKLLEVLDRVGLKKVLATYKGLDTMLGEGGLNLSGGQRQRLNFAGLYLRASFYRPVIILIDEPTSSLDEISEIAITQMIEELAQNAITLVIAHRLRTVEKAVGLIDLSLLSDEHEIRSYSPEELYHKSTYYYDLTQGKVHLDE